MKKIIILMIIAALLSDIKVYGEEINGIHAKAYALIDGDNNRLLVGENEDIRLANASTTKIMTCILALEKGGNPIVEASEYACSMPAVHMGFSKGERFYLKDLLYALMLESYNDAAVVVAESVGGNVDDFSEMMNDKANAIGMNNTNFVTPNGLDDKKHYSTAYDLAILGAYALKNKEFVKIINTESIIIWNVDKTKKYIICNKNNFLHMNNNALGIKTGFTNKAGYCFVGACKYKNKTFVSAVLASGWPPHKEYKYTDTNTLMKYGEENYSKKRLIKDKHMKINLINSNMDSIETKVSSPSKTLISNKDTIKLETKIHYKLPININDTVGTVNVYVNNQLTESDQLKACQCAEEFDFKYCFKYLIKNIVL